MTDIHPSAVVSPGAEIADDVTIGPYAVVGPHVTIGKGCIIREHAVLDGWTTLGEGCRLFPFACVGTETQDLKYQGAKTFVEIGDRTTIRECATVNASTNEGETTRVGSDCLLMAYTHVGHFCQVGNHVVMANCVALAGHVTVGDYAVFGGMTGIHQFVHVGTMSMVGGASKITQDCPPYMIVDGNPARVRGLNAVGLQRQGLSQEARSALKAAFRVFWRENLSVQGALDKIRASGELSPEVQHLIEFVENSERGITK